MKFNKGFTLAEALITLSVIGVVAALTVPMVAQKANKALTGPKLARVINQAETGNQDFFAYKTEQDDRTVNYTKFSDIKDDIPVSELAVFWGLTPYNSEAEIDLNDYKEFAYIPAMNIFPAAYAALVSPDLSPMIDGNKVNVDLGNEDKKGGEEDVDMWWGDVPPTYPEAEIPGAIDPLGNKYTNSDVIDAGKKEDTDQGNNEEEPTPEDNEEEQTPEDNEEEPTPEDNEGGGIPQTGCETQEACCTMYGRNLATSTPGSPAYKANSYLFNKKRCDAYYENKCQYWNKIIEDGVSLPSNDRLLYNYICTSDEPQPDSDGGDDGNEPNPPANIPTVKNYKSQKGGSDIVFDGDKLDKSKTGDNEVVINFYIDTNGNKGKPNMYGKDMFKFGLTNSGRIVPADDYAKQIVKDGYKVKYY